jgi:hypothetical protein
MDISVDILDNFMDKGHSRGHSWTLVDNRGQPWTTVDIGGHMVHSRIIDRIFVAFEDETDWRVHSNCPGCGTRWRPDSAGQELQQKMALIEAHTARGRRVENHPAS